MKTEEIKLEKELVDKEFYIFVSYYGGNTPYAVLSDKPDYLSDKVEKIYKIKIPYKLNNI